jgi:ADP-ribosylglycohydrolase
MYRPYIRDWVYPFLHSSATGICSDDTLLTLALADSIREKWWIDMEDIISRHVQAVGEEPFGFGKWTRSAMEKIWAWADWRNMIEPSFGNGVMMKQSPFAFQEVLSGENLSDDLIWLTRITHAHPVALVAARIHHKLMVDIILSESLDFDMKYWLQEAREYAKMCEDEFQASSQVSVLMTDIRIQWDDELDLWGIGNHYARKIESEKNPYFNVLSTLGICYALFLRKQGFDVVRQWASLWGDTDSYASILGSMVWALRGDIFPEIYKEGIHPRYKQKLDRTLGGGVS